MTDGRARPAAASPHALIEAARAAEREGRRAEARESYERALYALRTEEDAALAPMLLRSVAITYHVDGAPQEAMDIVVAAATIAELRGDLGAVGHALNLEAILQWQQGRLDEAEALYTRARSLAVTVGEPKLGAMAALNLGVLANVRGDYARAQRCYEEALGECRALGLTKEACSALNNLGMLFTDLARFEKAERCFADAIELAAVLGDTSARILLEVNVAELCLARRDWDGARAACDRARALAERANDMRAVGELHKHYGVIARERADFVQAEAHFAEAEKAAGTRQDLLLTAETARERAELYRAEGRYRDTLLQLNRARRLFEQLQARRDLADISKRNAKLEGQFLDVVRHWGTSIEAKDRYTQGHCERVADVSCALAARLDFDASVLFWFRVGALLHDVGKLMVPAEVLNKPGRLTADEWAQIRGHPLAGVEMLSDIEFPWDVLPMVRNHHERWDGKGYPDGLAGEAIPLEARVLCLADVYDALTSVRSYKRALTHDEAMAIMRSEAGTQFDPTLFAVFEREVAPALLRAEARMTPVRGMMSIPESLEDLPADDLTQVLTRRAFEEYTIRALREVGPQRPFALLVIDVDHFKSVNDRHGHLVGDAVLRRVAAQLREQVRGRGAVGRFAGDEFVVALPGCDAAAARSFAEQACASATAPTASAPPDLVTTLSIGVATTFAARSAFESLFGLADRALYAAKSAGRNGVVVASEGGTAVTGRGNVLERRHVGREREHELLRRALHDSLRGEPRLVVVSGEAGSGKTTTALQLSADVRLRAGMLAVGRADARPTRRPYGPWVEVLDAIERAGGLARAEHGRLFERLAAGGLDSDGSAPVIGSRVDDSSLAGHYRLLDDLVRVLREAAAARPLVVVLDDMQWADLTSWDALEYVLTHLEAERLLLVVTLRDEARAGAVGERRRRLARHHRAQEVRLARLSAAQVAEWVEGVLGDADADPAVAVYLHEHTSGNPLLLHQVLRDVTDAGALVYQSNSWEWRPLHAPLHNAPELVVRRLDRLKAPTLQLLSFGAVIGRRFPFDVLRQASGAAEQVVLRQLEDAHREGVIEPEYGTHYAFSHPLLVEALLRRTTDDGMSTIHAAVAMAIEACTPEASAALAYHWDGAGHREQAFRHAMDGARRAVSLHAHAEAAQCLRLAERNAADPLTRTEVWMELGVACESAGEYADAERWYTLALSQLSRLGPREGSQVDRSRRALALRRAAERMRTCLGRTPSEALAAGELLLGQAVSANDLLEQVEASLMLSEAHSARGEQQEAAEAAKAAARLAARTRDRRLHAAASMRHAEATLGTDPARSLELYDRARALFVQLADLSGEARCEIGAGVACTRLGRPADADAAHDRALALGRQARSPDIVSSASLLLGVSCLRGGRFDAAATYLNEVLGTYTALRSTRLQARATLNLAHLARERGDGAEAEALYRGAATLAAESGDTEVQQVAFAGAGLAALAAGRVEQAQLHGVQSASVRPAQETGSWYEGKEIVDALEIRLALVRGEPALALGLARSAVAAAERHDRFAAASLAAECALALVLAGGTDEAMIKQLLLHCERLAADSGAAPAAARLRRGLSILMESDAGGADPATGRPEARSASRPGMPPVRSLPA